MLRRAGFRVLAVILVLAALVHVATLWPRVASLATAVGPYAWVAVGLAVLTALTALVACGIAILLVWRVPDRPDARALTLFLAFLAICWGSLFRFVEVQSGVSDISVNLRYGGTWVSRAALASFLLALASFLRFSALFPRPLTPHRLPPARFGGWLRQVRVAFLSPSVVWGATVLVILIVRYAPRLAMRISGTPAAAGFAFLGIMLLMAGAAIAAIMLGAQNLRDSRRTATPPEQRRILWVVTGFSAASWMLVAALGMLAVAMIGGAVGTVLAVVVPLTLVMVPLVVVLSAAIGILYAGAIDPVLALRRSTIYGVLGAIGVVAFTVIESGLSELVERWVPLPGFVGPVLAGALVTAGLVPLRSALKRWVSAAPEDETPPTGVEQNRRADPARRQEGGG